MVVMMGTAPEGQGGVASVVATYREAGLFSRREVRYVASHADGSPWHKLAMAVSAGCGLAWQLLRGRVALLHLHSSHGGSFYRKSVYALMARWAGAKTVFHIHSGTFANFAGPNPASLRHRWIVHTLERSDAVVTLSDNWASVIRGIAPGARTFAIPNPVALPDRTSSYDGEGARILFLGRADTNKGVFDLLECLPRLHAEFPGLKLAIGGDGDLGAVRERALSLGVEAQIEVLGWVTGAAKREQIERASLYVLPSYAEGLPMALLECMAYGKAVLASPVGAIPEVVQDGVNGYLVQAGQVAEIADKLATLMRDRELRNRLGREAQRTIRGGYSAEQVVAQVLRLYEILGISEQQS